MLINVVNGMNGDMFCVLVNVFMFVIMLYIMFSCVLLGVLLLNLYLRCMWVKILLLFICEFCSVFEVFLFFNKVSSLDILFVIVELNRLMLFFEKYICLNLILILLCW